MTSDINPNNILLDLDDKVCFEKHDDDDVIRPVPRNELEDPTIYLSNRVISLTSADSIISDFSAARFGDRENTHGAICEAYRAPEVMLGMP